MPTGQPERATDAQWIPVLAATFRSTLRGMNHVLSLGVLLLLALASCATATETLISHSFRNPGFENTAFKELLVIGVDDDQQGRVAFENAFVKAIENEGGAAHPSWKGLPATTLIAEEQFRTLATQTGSDGILITRLLSVERDVTDFQRGGKSVRGRKRLGFVPGGIAGGPAWGVGGFHSFYATSFTEVHGEEYFSTQMTVRLETNLYSVATNSLVWTAQTQTIDPESVSALLDSMTAAVAKRLKEESLLP